MVRIHHPVTGATVDVPDRAFASHAKRGWVRVDKPAVVTAPKPAVIAAPVAPEVGDVEVDEREALLELADDLGVAVDRRWGVSRLSEAIAAFHGDEHPVPEGDDNPTPSQED